MNLIQDIFHILGLLISFAFVLGLSYFVTKYVSIKYGSQLKSRNMQVIESLSLGVDRTLHLIKVGERIYLIGISNKNISYLTEIHKDEVNTEMHRDQKELFDFSHYLKHFIDKRKQ